MPARLRVTLALVLLALLWGTAFVGIKEALAEISPATLTILRFAVADVCLVALAAIWPAARPRAERGTAIRLIALGVLGVPGYHLTLNWGAARTSASLAALVVATAPVLVAVLSAAVLGERVRARGVIGIALAFGGVALLALAGPTQDPHARTSVAGVLVALGAPLSWAVYTIVARPLAKPGAAVRVTTASMLLGSIMLVPLLRPSFFGEAARLSASGWAWVVYLGAGGSVAGYVLFIWALGKIGATRLAVAIYMVPVVALLMAWAIRGEPLGAVTAVAAIFVVGGVVLTERGGVVQREQEALPVEEPVVYPKNTSATP